MASRGHAGNHLGGSGSHNLPSTPETSSTNHFALGSTKRAPERGPPVPGRLEDFEQPSFSERTGRIEHKGLECLSAVPILVLLESRIGCHPGSRPRSRVRGLLPLLATDCERARLGSPTASACAFVTDINRGIAGAKPRQGFLDSWYLHNIEGTLGVAIPRTAKSCSTPN